MNPKNAFISLCVGLAVGWTVRTDARVTIQNKGSDTLFGVAQAWSEAYGKRYPDIAVVVTGGGSGTGIANLINGTADLANSSRTPLPREVADAQKKNIDIVEHTIGHDALAIYVNAANPLPSITLKQLAEIYGDGGSIRDWNQLGVTIPGCKPDKMILVNRQNNSGSYIYFQGAVFGGGRDFRLGTMDMEGSKEVVTVVEKTPCAIGYSSLSFATSAVKRIPVARDDRAPPVEASMTTVANRSYPIWRPLFLFTRGEPHGEVKRYLDWIKSDAGQCILRKKGFATLHEARCD
ncbi:MAG: phosphate ABC transporter substrate-binding protein [Magnetococcales bacterium]|nr:phosphate ABC transporter substrate-binding protein [Magnetococcales bacterium]